MRRESVSRPEHPRPQFERGDWVSLNGEWTFEFDFGKSGSDRGLAHSQGFSQRIKVPFCPESCLSGVGHTDFIEMMWYQRKISIPAEWKGKKALLHFGAVDYVAEAYVDGVFTGRHFGGSSSFCFDITALVKAGKEHSLVLKVSDELRTGHQPGGKQSHKFHSFGCHYTRTTGIWQSVWLEAVAECSLKSCRIIPDFDGGSFSFIPLFRSLRKGMKLKVSVLDGSREVAFAAVAACDGVPVKCDIPNPKPWSPGSPFLYGVLFEVLDSKGKVRDTVRSYAGLRSVRVEGNKILLNNEPLYLRLVLDQGFYPDGIWTVPSDRALKKDIQLSMASGFNGARLHQKVFEERFHYWADKLGYLTWAEFTSWGADMKDPTDARNVLSEWAEIVQRDANHPSIIAWTPLNETSDIGDGIQHNRLHRDIYDLTKSLDPTRPVNEASGYVHVKTDLWTVHNYEQDPKELRKQLVPENGRGVFRNFPDKEAQYEGQPYLVDEFGGIKWVPGKPFAENTWGYGKGPSSLEELYNRLEGQVDAILSLEHVCGYCYTQLTDVEQEQNGLYNYDRSEKFDMARIRGIFSKDPADKGA